MIISNKYKEVEPQKTLERESLSLGQHILEIKVVTEYNSNNNKACLRVITDVEEGSRFDGYFQKLLDNRTTDDNRWPNEGTKYIPTGENSLGYFKYFIHVLEKSNNVFIDIPEDEDLDLNQFKGLKFVGVFGLREYENGDGEVKISLNITSFHAIGEECENTIPDVKLINGTYMPYEEYMDLKKGIKKQEPVQEQMSFEKDSHEIVDIDVEAPEYPFD